ncbi:NAD-dependent epimerase/dehydratase family protein [Candidatus Bathyarchaeota archaeon]|nr:NAD-dependent epimerase/dehydratase family protein [Candidatus Bathyarchaeota archaeon]
MKVLVTGGCGFIGSHLVERLVKDGHDVIVFDNLNTGNPKNIEGLGVEFFNEPYEKIGSIAHNINIIFHLGMPSSSPMYKRDPYLVGKTVNDAITILEYAKRNSCKVVYASTSSLYNGNPVPYREDMPIYVTDYYTECRYAIERLAKLYNILYGVKSVGLRLFSVYGPKEQYKGEYANVVSQFLWKIMRNEPPIIFGDGTQTRDFIHVNDVVEAFKLAAEGDFDCEIFNVGTGVEHSFNDVVDIINRVLGKKIEPVYKPNPIKNYVYRTLADTAKAEKMLGFKAKITLEEGIRDLAQYYLTQSIKTS